jgi:two-component system chemotaxis sensor kinase CheA
MVMIQNKLMPIIRLYRLFGVVPSNEDPTKSLLVVVEDGDNRCCLQVDELLGQQQVVIKNLGDGLGKVKGISGGAIMGDGRISLILDIPNLIELAHKN